MSSFNEWVKHPLYELSRVFSNWTGYAADLYDTGKEDGQADAEEYYEEEMLKLEEEFEEEYSNYVQATDKDGDEWETDPYDNFDDPMKDVMPFEDTVLPDPTPQQGLWDPHEYEPF